nr:hypothetical protein CFP56_19067 [Quercus suber]
MGLCGWFMRSRKEEGEGGHRLGEAENHWKLSKIGKISLNPKRFPPNRRVKSEEISTKSCGELIESVLWW